MEKFVIVCLICILLFGCISKNAGSDTAFGVAANRHLSRREVFNTLLYNGSIAKYKKSELVENLDEEIKKGWSQLLRLREKLDQVSVRGERPDLSSLARAFDIAVKTMGDSKITFGMYLPDINAVDASDIGLDVCKVIDRINYLGASYDIPEYLYPFNEKALKQASAWDVLMIMDKIHNVRIQFVLKDDGEILILLEDYRTGSGVNNIWPDGWW